MSARVSTRGALLLAALVLALAPGVSCGRLGKFHRFFLTDCAAGGPVREPEFELVLREVPLVDYTRELLSAAGAADREIVAQIEHASGALPIHHIGPIGLPSAQRLLVVAGVHGNEIAGILAAPRIIGDFRRRVPSGVELHVVAPANPVGLVHQSRYNARGCDINRDFGPFETVEAKALAQLFERVQPTLVVSLHEGPGDGFYVIATRSAPLAAAQAMAAAVSAAGLEVSGVDNLGRRADQPGIMHEGWFISMGKRVLGVDSLGAFAHSKGVGTLTIETRWDEPDLDRRIEAQVIAVGALVDFLSAPPD